MPPTLSEDETSHRPHRRTPLIILVIILGLLVIAEGVAFAFGPSWFAQPSPTNGTRQTASSSAAKDLASEEGNVLGDTTTLADQIADALNANPNSEGPTAEQLQNALADPLVNETFNGLVLLSCVIADYPETKGFGNDAAPPPSDEERRVAQTQCHDLFSTDDIDRAHEAALQDDDADGLNSLLETTIGTNPYVVDTDGDGFDDLTEVQNGHDPLVGPKEPSASP